MAKSRSLPQTDSAVYNIKAVVNQTGLNPATIRAWERRYGVPRPGRSDGGHRQYSQRDVNILKWLVARQEEGMSISHAIEHWQSLVEAGEDPVQFGFVYGPPARHSVTPELGKQIDDLRAAWVNSCLAFDRESAERVLTRAFALFAPETVCTQLLQKGLVEIGDGWHQGIVTVQQEHFASTLSEQRLEVLISAAPAPVRQERIVVSGASGDHHTFGPLLLTYMLRRRGWDVVHLGADVPVKDFRSTIDKLQAHLVIVSAQLFHTAAAIKEVAWSLQSDNTLLAYGGLAFNLMPEIRQHMPGYFLGETLEKAVEVTANLLSSQRPKVMESQQQDESYREAIAHFHERQSLIESHVWETFTTEGIPTKQLSALNSEISHLISAALTLGDINLLKTDIAWIEDMFMSFLQPGISIQDYLLAYYQGAKKYLDEPAQIIVGWLAEFALT